MAAKVIVLVDGTWCGPETNTESNIHYLAKMIGINPTSTDPTYTSPTGDVHARYFTGVGLGGSFMSYLWDGALATHAERDCNDVYDYIVQNFALGKEVWMFGISRGAYIVRSVAGMINNCGIIRDQTNNTLIREVYSLYRSPHAVHEPWSPEMNAFRLAASHPASTPPIKFMGLFDTVGSRGIPKLNYDTGVGFEWPEFHDIEVSSEVEKVYHAVAMHDRLWAFQPCLASRQQKHIARTDLVIHQKWFPGAHYDLARQEFQFLREGNRGLEGVVSSIINKFSKTVSPNLQLADLVLLWILDGIRAEGGGAIIRNDMGGGANSIDVIITNLQNGLPMAHIGTGDMYANILSYLPLAFLWGIPQLVTSLTNPILYQILLSPQDRVIPDPGNPMNPLVQNEVYNYTVGDLNLASNNIGNTAQVGTLLQQNPRYPSRTFQNYVTYMAATGRRP